MAGAMAEASYATGVSIIACTGFHKQNFYYEDSFIFREKEETLAGLFTSEVTDGMLPSGRDEKKRLEARAGVIKVAVEKNGVRTNAAYEKLFAAAAAAAAKTGAPVLAHFDKDADALALIEYLGQYNIPANRLIACHLDRARYDIGYHREVAQSGAWMEYDTINRLKYHDNEKEFKLIQGMIEAGYAGRMLFSLDTTNKRLRAYGADMGLDYLLKEFTVYMQQRGLGGYMRQIMVNNPAQAVAIQKGTEEKRTAASAITHHVPLM